MSNIGLLMASVLVTGLSPAKELSQSPQIEPESSLEEEALQLKEKQKTKEIQSSPIAPPERFELDVSDSDIHLEIESESEFESILPQAIPTEKNSLNISSKHISSKDISSKVYSGISPPEIIHSEVRIENNGFSHPPQDRALTRKLDRQGFQRAEFRTQKSPLTTHHSPLTTQNSPLTTQNSPITTQNSPLTTHHSPLTNHHSPLTTQQPKLLISKLTSVSQLDDVQPDDWAFGALQSLVERYGCSIGYKDGTYGGNRGINRYEFAAGLATCLQRINELIANDTDRSVKEEDLLLVQRLQTDFQTELQQLEKRVENLEETTTQLQAKNFSPNTKLFGQAILSVQGNNNPKVDLFPRDGQTERQAKSNLSLNNSVQLTLATSFTGKDLLLTGLSTGNLGSSAPLVFNNMGRLGYESDTDNDVVVNELSYRFAVSDNLGFVVGTAGVNPVSTFRGINPLEGSGEGAISLFGQRNPILTVGNGRSGVAFDWEISDRVSLQGIYNTEAASFPGNNNGAGLFNGRYAAGAQLSLAPTDNVNVGVHYLYSHSPDASLGTGIGDAQLVSPFAPATEFDTQAVGATIAWRVNPNLEVGGWGGWTYSDPKNLSGNVQTTNWAVFAALPNLGKTGNLGGAIVGQPPKITSSSLPDGFNFPNFSEGGIEGGRKDTSLHVELFYRAQVNQNLSLTPGVFVVFNPDHNKSNEPLVVGALRATYRF